MGARSSRGEVGTRVRVRTKRRVGGKEESGETATRWGGGGGWLATPTRHARRFLPKSLTHCVMRGKGKLVFFIAPPFGDIIINFDY